MRLPLSGKYDKPSYETLRKIRQQQAEIIGLMKVAHMQHLRDTCAHATDPTRLLIHEHRTFSQHGEDGIIAEIFRRIGTTNKVFAEFGAGNGLENNTVGLLCRGFNGVWIEGGDEQAQSIRKNCAPFLASGAIRFKQGFVYAENIETIFEEMKVPAEFDLLSIDIDGNDYWLWKAITRFKPRVVVIEYNSNYPPDVSWIMKYNPKHAWAGGSHFGASLLALEKLGASKGYSLVGCDFYGVNAFFVQREYEGKFTGPFTAANHFEPPRFRLGTTQWTAPVLGEFVSE